MAVPQFEELFNPILKALRELGGSASVSELDNKVISSLKLSDKDINEKHRGNQTKLCYRLSWARSYLKKHEYLENSVRGVWALTRIKRNTKSVDKNEVKKWKSLRKGEKVKPGKGIADDFDAETTWKDELLDIVKSISPDAFERLCQRVLRESGFTQVVVTGQSGDGGIDGMGVVKLGGLLSFHVVFQCKRYNNSVAPKYIRDFRGAMIGRAEKGLLITTGTFTKEARAEANRDGAPAIDLIDGNELAEKMKSLELGVSIKEEKVEHIIINKEWLNSF